MATMRMRRALGFAGTESGLLMIVDPTALQPYLRDGVMEDWIAAALKAFGDGENEIPLGTEGGQAVVTCGTSRGRHVLVREELPGGDMDFVEDIRDAG